MKIFFLGTRETKERKLITCKSEALPFKLALINILVGFTLFNLTITKNFDKGSLKANVTSVNQIMVEDDKKLLKPIYYADLSLNINGEDKIIKLNLDKNNYNEFERILNNDFEISYDVNYIKNKISDFIYFDIKADSIKIKEKDILISSNTYFETEIDVFSDNYNIIDPSYEEVTKKKNISEPHMTNEEFKEKVYEDIILRGNSVKRSK